MWLKFTDSENNILLYNVIVLVIKTLKSIINSDLDKKSQISKIIKVGFTKEYESAVEEIEILDEIFDLAVHSDDPTFNQEDCEKYYQKLKKLILEL